MSEEWFSTQTSFLANVFYAQITDVPHRLVDNTLVRATYVLGRFDLIGPGGHCPHCRKELCLTMRKDKGTLVWQCPVDKNHYRNQPETCDALMRVHQNHWPAFLNLIVLLKAGRCLNEIKDEIKAAFQFNLKDDTMLTWRRLYQGKLQAANVKYDLLKIGSKDVVTVVDETLVGIHHGDGLEVMATKGIRKAKPHIRTSRRSRQVIKNKIFKRLPARTIHKKPAGHTTHEPLKFVLKKPAVVKKKPSAATFKRPAGVQGTDQDPRSNGRWLWAAVTVGKGDELYTHGNGLKRFTFRFLKKKSEAAHGKPRGYEEISDTLNMCIRHGSIIVSDKWTGTVKAVRALGYRSPPAINHGVEFRDRETGFHSNDIESENNRLKAWARHRYSRLQLTEEDLHEYTFYINKGSLMADVMQALAL